MVLIKISDSAVINRNNIVSISVENVLRDYKGWEIRFSIGDDIYFYRLNKLQTEATAKEFFERVCFEIVTSAENHIISMASLEAKCISIQEAERILHCEES